MANKKNNTEKKSAPLAAFRLSPETQALLKLIAEKERRTRTAVLEILIEEKAAALKIKVK